MRPCPLIVAAATSTFLIVSIVIPGAATGQPAIGQSWGGNALNWIPPSWPTIAIAVLVGVLIAGLLGVFDLDWPRAVFLLAAIALLVYGFH